MRDGEDTFSAYLKFLGKGWNKYTSQPNLIL